MRLSLLLLASICSFCSITKTNDNPLQGLNIPFLTSKKIDNITWFGQVDIGDPTAWYISVWAVVKKEPKSSPYIYSIEYVQGDQTSLPAGLFQHTDGPFIARKKDKPGTKLDDFLAFTWNETDKQWKDITEGKTLDELPRYKHPTQQITTALESAANKREPSVEPKKPEPKKDLAPLLESIRNLQQSLDALSQKLDTTRKSPLVKKLDNTTYQIADVQINIQQENITQMRVDAIVNAAGKFLPKTPSGVAQAIWKDAGAQQLNDWISKHINLPISTGQAQWTPSFNLSTKGIIQAVGPDCGAGENITLLYNTYKSSIDLANSKGYQSIAFPPISTNIFKCDRQQCAKLAIKAIVENAPGTTLKVIYLVDLTPSLYLEYLTQELDTYLKK